MRETPTMSVPRLIILPLVNPAAWALIITGCSSTVLAEIPKEKPQARQYALLFAAALELYDALEEQLGFTPQGPCQKELIPICRCETCKSDRARAALAKARGEKPV